MARSYNFNIVYSRYRRRAKKSGLNFSLTKDEFFKITQRKCYLCGCKPSLTFKNHPHRKNIKGYTYNGIDRVDSSLGYELGNVEPCCKTCNYMKRDMSLGEFKEHILSIVGNALT